MYKGTYDIMLHGAYSGGHLDSRSSHVGAVTKYGGDVDGSSQELYENVIHI